MSNAKYAPVNSEEIGVIDAVRRVSGIQLSNRGNNPEAASEQVYIEAIRRVSGVNVGANAKDIINMRREQSAAKIQAERGLSSAEIGVIEGVRRLSGINAALLEMGEPAAKNKPGDIVVGADGKIVVAPQEEAGKKSNGLGDKEWHLFPEKDLLHELETNIGGLTAAEVEKRLEIYGLNEITPVPTTHWFIKFLMTLVGGFQLMMWFGSILCWVVYGISNGTDVQTLALAIVLIMVVLLSGCFQSYQVRQVSIYHNRTY
jgi:magnesium-transporting ATPase (P-type)